MSTETDHAFSITLQGREIDIVRRFLPQHELRFYLQNPRVYSVVRHDGGEPEQDDIQDALARMDHVKQLVQAIRQNGGLTDPLLVRGVDRVVLEGNSRLAAYRLLAKNQPVVWGLVKCDVVTVDITDEQVIALLTHYHIIGRKSWDPYEQAGMFWRWFREGFTMDEISKRVEEIGISAKKIRQWIKVYSLMVEKGANNPNQWSYYDEFVRSRYITKSREEHPELTNVFVETVQSGESGKAVDVRGKIAKIAKVGGGSLKDFVDKKEAMDNCYEKAVAYGATDILYNKLRRFREVIADPAAKIDVLDMSPALRSKCIYEFRRIKNAVVRLIDACENGQK